MTHDLARGGALPAIIVGAGLMGRWHAYEIKRLGGRVVAVVDPEPERARTLARRFGADAVTSDLADVPRGAGPEVVHVCSPSGTHEPWIERALDSGRHVLVEKPLASDADTTERLLTGADAAGCLLAPVHQFPFQRGVQRLLRDRERVGELVELRGEARSAGAEGAPESEQDRIALEIVPHFLALTRRFLPGGIRDIAWHLDRPRPGELAASAVVDRILVDLRISMGGRPPVNRWRVVGATGTGEADLFHGFARFEPGDMSRAWKVARPLARSAGEIAIAAGNLVGRAVRRQPAYPGLRELIAAFHAAAAGNGERPVPVSETLEVARTLDRFRAASAPE